jgi:4'-phosphopantetheinyl transferase EntD
VVIDVAFDLELDHGRCVGLRVPAGLDEIAALEASLLPEERAFAGSLPALRRRTWVGGRVALRQAFSRAGVDVPTPVFSDDRGALALPQAVSASVTHKEDIAAALVSRLSGVRVGVDVEHDALRKQDIASRVLADDEIADLAPHDASGRSREVLLRFSAKEAIYKALDPFVRRYVGFKEVSVSTDPDGGARVTCRLRHGEGPFAIDVRWRRFDGLVLTTARVERSARPNVV